MANWVDSSTKGIMVNLLEIPRLWKKFQEWWNKKKLPPQR